MGYLLSSFSRSLSKVMACCKGSKKQYPGTIFKDNRDGTYDVKFDNWLICINPTQEK